LTHLSATRRGARRQVNVKDLYGEGSGTPPESVGEIDLRASVRSLCLCGECFLE